MRIPFERDRSTSSPDAFTISYSGGYPPNVWPSVRSVSRMWDSYRGGYHGQIRPMERYVLEVRPQQAFLGSYGSEWSAWAGGSPLGTPFLTADSLISLSSSPPDSVWERFGEQAFIRFSTQISQDLDLAASLYEMREIASLALQLVEQSASLARRLVEVQGSTSIRDAIRGGLDSALETAGGAYIMSKFGLEPLWRDVTNVMGAFGSLNSQIERLRKLNGKVTRLTMGTVPGHAIKPALPPWVEIPSGYPTFVRLRLLSAEDKFFFSSYLDAKLDDLDSMGGWVRGLMTKVGLNNPLGTIWELTQNSWFIDWFVGISPLLKRWAVTFLNPYKGKWDLTRQCTTYTATWRYEMQIRSTVLSSEWANFGEVLVRRHQRIPFLPVPALVSMGGGLNPSQLLLSGALVASKGL